MEGHCSTDQSPQWAVVPMEEEEEEEEEEGGRERERERERDSWWQIGKQNGRTLFDRPKPTVGCSANGRRRILTISTKHVE